MADAQDNGKRWATVGPDASPEFRKAAIKAANAEHADVTWHGATVVISRHG